MECKEFLSTLGALGHGGNSYSTPWFVPTLSSIPGELCTQEPMVKDHICRSLWIMGWESLYIYTGFLQPSMQESPVVGALLHWVLHNSCAEYAVTQVWPFCP